MGLKRGIIGIIVITTIIQVINPDFYLLNGSQAKEIQSS